MAGANKDVENASGAPKFARKLKGRLDSYEKRPTVSSDQIRARWDSNSEKREETLNKLKQPSSISNIGGALLLLISLGMIVSTVLGASSYNNKLSAAKTNYANAKSNLAAIKHTDSSVPSVKQAQSVLQTLIPMGKKVADVQNWYHSKQSGDPTMITKQSRSIQGYFDQYTVSAIGPWYEIAKDKTNKYSNMKYSWTFNTPYSFENNGNTVNVSWTCKNDKGEVLAWALGEYTTSTHKIDGILWGNTDKGNLYMGTPDSYAPGGKTGDTGAATGPSSSSSSTSSILPSSSGSH